MKQKLLKIVPHVTIVISGMLIVFFAIDRVNKAMGFMTNEFHRVITFILALLSVGQSIAIIAFQRKRERQIEARRRQEAQKRRAAQQTRRAAAPAAVRPPRAETQAARPNGARPMR